jgi:hypothetical protein
MKKCFYAAVILLLFAACKPPVKREQLFGTWKYTKLENPYADPPDSMTSYKLQANSPSIRFTKNDSLVIIWSDTVLLKGKFTVDGRNINFTGLSSGKSTHFPFIVSKLTDKVIVFETEGTDGSRVTAVKE